MRGMPRAEAQRSADEVSEDENAVNAASTTDKSMPDDALSLHWTGPQPRLRRSLALPVTSAAQPSWDIAHDRAARAGLRERTEEAATTAAAAALAAPLAAPLAANAARDSTSGPPGAAANDGRARSAGARSAARRRARLLALSAAPGAPSLALADTLSDVRSRMSSRQRVEGATPRPWHDSSRALGMALPKLEDASRPAGADRAAARRRHAAAVARARRAPKPVPMKH